MYEVYFKFDDKDTIELVALLDTVEDCKAYSKSVPGKIQVYNQVTEEAFIL